MSAAALAQTILTFVGIVGIGVALRLTGLISSTETKPLNAVIVYVGLPAMIIRAIRSSEVGTSVIGVVAVAWLVFIVSLLIAWILTRILRLPKRTAGAFLVTAALGNTGYIGYPVVSAVLGEDALPLAIFSDVFGTVFAFVLVGFAIARRFGSPEHAVGSPGAEGPVARLRQRLGVVGDLVTFPAFVALVVGLALRSAPVPDVVSAGLDILANLVVPLIMISVGIALKPATIRRALVPLLCLVALRLGLAPIFARFAGPVFIADGEALRVAALEAGMPTMMLTLVLGTRFGLDTDFIASAIFCTTAGAALSLPILQALFW